MVQFSDALSHLEASKSPAPQFIEDVFSTILHGKWSATQTAAFAVALRMKGETPEIIAAAAQAMRAQMVPLEHERTKTLDTCGTGGDGLGSLNLSTGAAIISAAAGARVAKHGNRAVSSKSGSADVLEKLGVRIDLSAEAEAQVFRETGITFQFAPTHHPAMRHVAPARRELGVRTIFNCLGPLASPAKVTHQLLGAYDDSLRPILAGTLQKLEIKRAWVVRGQDGMDEMSPFATTNVTILQNGRLEERILSPEDFGLPFCQAGATEGGDADHNAEILLQVLRGKEHPSRDAFILNAAAAICVLDDTALHDATARARTAVESGAALAKLEEWVEASKKQ